ncbi:hypothetical protein LSAT2_025975 [Lamellibrachia satsuma]|nr:hypothetical protein LSAT2_025975 [Lamellibrachia satsuma]
MDDRGRPDLYGDNRSNLFLARVVNKTLNEDHVLQPGTHFDFSYGQNPNPVDFSKRYETTTGESYSAVLQSRTAKTKSEAPTWDPSRNFEMHHPHVAPLPKSTYGESTKMADYRGLPSEMRPPITAKAHNWHEMEEKYMDDPRICHLDTSYNKQFSETLNNRTPPAEYRHISTGKVKLPIVRENDKMNLAKGVHIVYGYDPQRYDSELHFAFQNRNYDNPSTNNTPYLREIFWRGKKHFIENKRRRNITSLLKHDDYNSRALLGQGAGTMNMLDYTRKLHPTTKPCLAVKYSPLLSKPGASLCTGPKEAMRPCEPEWHERGWHLPPGKLDDCLHTTMPALIDQSLQQVPDTFQAAQNMKDQFSSSNITMGYADTKDRDDGLSHCDYKWPDVERPITKATKYPDNEVISRDPDKGTGRTTLQEERLTKPLEVARVLPNDTKVKVTGRGFTISDDPTRHLGDRQTSATMHEYRNPPPGSHDVTRYTGPVDKYNHVTESHPQGPDSLVKDSDYKDNFHGTFMNHEACLAKRDSIKKAGQWSSHENHSAHFSVGYTAPLLHGETQDMYRGVRSSNENNPPAGLAYPIPTYKRPYLPFSDNTGTMDPNSGELKPISMGHNNPLPVYNASMTTCSFQPMENRWLTPWQDKIVKCCDIKNAKKTMSKTHFFHEDNYSGNAKRQTTQQADFIKPQLRPDNLVVIRRLDPDPFIVGSQNKDDYFTMNYLYPTQGGVQLQPMLESSTGAGHS